METLALAWCVLCALAAHKPAHGHGYGHGRKTERNEFWRELRHKGDCCCFRWAMYAPWAFYMGIWALYNPKLPIWPLIGLPDLAGDQPLLLRCASASAGAGTVNLVPVCLITTA